MPNKIRAGGRWLIGKKWRVLLLVALPLSVWALILLATAIGYSGAQYGDKYLVSNPVEVCPGDEFSFPISVVVPEGDTVARVTEGWHRPDGTGPDALQKLPIYYNFVDPYELHRSTTRVVPESITPGVWQLRHCIETHSDGRPISVSCFKVDVKVKETCP